MQDSAK
jgi:hypothetical protein